MGVIAESNDFLKTLITVVFTGSSTITIRTLVFTSSFTAWIKHFGYHEH